MSSSLAPHASAVISDKQDAAIREKVTTYIIENLLLGADDNIHEDASLLGSGILDSTGALELVAFLEQEFRLTIKDSDLTPDNLDSIARIAAFVLTKRAGGNG